MAIIWRYQAALVGAFLAMFIHVYALYGRGEWLHLPRLGQALGAGLIFGHLAAAGIIISRDLPHLLQTRFHRSWSLLIGLCCGILFWGAAWWSHAAFFLLNSTPDWLMIGAGGLLCALGFWIGALEIPANRLLRLMIVGMTGLCVALPVILTYLEYRSTLYEAVPRQALLYFRDLSQMWLVGSVFVSFITLLGQLPLLLNLTDRYSAN